MGYYIRVLAEKEDPIPVSQIQAWLQAAGLTNVDVIVEDGDSESWNQVTLKRKRGKELVTIERNPIEPHSLGEEELHEFISEVRDAKPKSAANWLKEYLPTVRAIYAFQILFHTNKNDDWREVHIVQENIWNTLDGILQADGEGFSNREGYHILWQFSDHVTGTWNMAVLAETGRWRIFQMDLGNPEHRKAFLEGKVPKGVKSKQGV
jgi:hypothetical protein